MTFWTRVAAFATLTCTISGLLGTSTPSAAAQLAAATTTSSAASEGDNTSAALPVPAVIADDATGAAAATTRYASLDAAIADQDDASADETLRCLAGAIYYEARSEPLAGQLAVAEVILNRAKSGRFPPDVCGVVLQRGQFGFVRGGAIPAIDATRASWKRAIAIAKVAIRDVWDSPASDALYFNAVRRSPGARTVRVAAIGNHIFYR